MKVALCFWGLTRSLKYTIKSIQEHVFDPLKQNNVEYIIFLHTYKFDSPYINPRAQEIYVKLDFDEYKLLNPDYVQIDDQDEVKQRIHIEKYRSMPDPWQSNYVCVDNFVCAMYSKKQLGIMVKDSKIDFDYIVYLRPDVNFLTSFDIRYFSIVKKNTICTPNFHLFPKLNDRFCILKPNNLEKYSRLFDCMYEFSTIFPLHSEKFQHHVMTRNYKWIIKYVSFLFNRVRYNGNELQDCAKLFKMRNQPSHIKMVKIKQTISQTKSNSKQNAPMFKMKDEL